MKVLGALVSLKGINMVLDLIIKLWLRFMNHYLVLRLLINLMVYESPDKGLVVKGKHVSLLVHPT